MVIAKMLRQIEITNKDINLLIENLRGVKSTITDETIFEKAITVFKIYIQEDAVTTGVFQKTKSNVHACEKEVASSKNKVVSKGQVRPENIAEERLLYLETKKIQILLRELILQRKDYRLRAMAIRVLGTIIDVCANLKRLKNMCIFNDVQENINCTMKTDRASEFLSNCLDILRDPLDGESIIEFIIKNTETHMGILRYAVAEFFTACFGDFRLYTELTRMFDLSVYVKNRICDSSIYIRRITAKLITHLVNIETQQNAKSHDKSILLDVKKYMSEVLDGSIQENRYGGNKEKMYNFECLSHTLLENADQKFVEEMVTPRLEMIINTLIQVRNDAYEAATVLKLVKVYLQKKIGNFGGNVLEDEGFLKTFVSTLLRIFNETTVEDESLFVVVLNVFRLILVELSSLDGEHENQITGAVDKIYNMFKTCFIMCMDKMLGLRDEVTGEAQLYNARRHMESPVYACHVQVVEFIEKFETFINEKVEKTRRHNTNLPICATQILSVIVPTVGIVSSRAKNAQLLKLLLVATERVLISIRQPKLGALFLDSLMSAVDREVGYGDTGFRLTVMKKVMEIAGNLTVGTRSLSKLLYIFASQLDSKIKTDSSLLRVTEENMSIRLVDKDYQVRELVTDYISKLIDSENSELISDGLLQNAFALVLDPEAEVRAAALKLAMKTYSQKNQRFFMMKAQLTTDTLHRLLGDSHSLVRMCAIDFLTCVVISLNVDTDNLYRAYLFAFDKGTLGALSADTESGVQLRLISLLEALLASLFTVFSGIGRFCHNCNASLILGLMDLDLHKSLIAFTKNFLRLVRSNATDALVRLRPLAQMDQSAATHTSSNFCVQCKANQNPSRIGYVSVDLNCLHKSVANLVQDFGLHFDALDFDGLMESNKSESVYGELFDPGLFISTSVSSELGDSAHINVLDCY